MAKPIATWAGGIHSLTQFAARADGALFQRHQNRTPYGYRWGAWRQVGNVDTTALPTSISAGFSNCYRSLVSARLPNA